MTVSALPLVYVVVPSWNLRDDTLECLASLSQSDYRNVRVLLVDNGSVDGTMVAVNERFPEVEVHRNATNLGFAAGSNVGIRRALEQGADYIFLVNNDTIVDPGAVSALVTAMEPDVGIAAPKIYYADDPQRIWMIGGKRHALTYEKVGDPIGQLDTGQWDRVLEQDYLPGCAMLLSRRMLEDVGMFDERYISYYEDTDLSYRTRQAGYRLLMVPDARLWHKVARSSGGADSPNERYWMARGSVIFFSKFVQGWRWFIVIPYRLGSGLKTCLRLAWRRRWVSLLSYLRGLRDGLREVLGSKS